MVAAENLFMYLFSINQLVLLVGIGLIILGLLRMRRPQLSAPDPSTVPPHQTPVDTALASAGVTNNTYNAPVYNNCKVKIIDYSNSQITRNVTNERREIINAVSAEQWEQFFTAQTLNQDILNQILVQLQTGNTSSTTNNIDNSTTNNIDNSTTDNSTTNNTNNTTNNIDNSTTDNSVVNISIDNRVSNYFSYVLLNLGVPTNVDPEIDCKGAWTELLKRRRLILNQLKQIVEDHKTDGSNPGLNKLKNNARLLCSHLSIYLPQEIEGRGQPLGGRVVNLEGTELNVSDPFMVLNDPFIVYHSELWRGEVAAQVRQENYDRCKELHMGPSGTDLYDLAKDLHAQWRRLYECKDEDHFVTEYHALFGYLERLLLPLAQHYHILSKFSDEQIINAIFCMNRVQQNLLHYRLFNTLWEFETQPLVPYHDVDAWWRFWSQHKNGIQHLWKSQAFGLLGEVTNVTTPEVLEHRINLTMELFRKYDRGNEAACDYSLRDGISFMLRFLSDDTGYRFERVSWFDGRIVHTELTSVYGRIFEHPNKYKNMHDKYHTVLQLSRSNTSWEEIQSQLRELDLIIKADIEHIRDTVYPLLDPDKPLYSNNDFRAALMKSIDEAKRVQKWDVSKLPGMDDTGLGLPMLPLSHALGPHTQTPGHCEQYVKDWYAYWVGDEGLTKTKSEIDSIISATVDNGSTWKQCEDVLVHTAVLFRTVNNAACLRDGFQSVKLYADSHNLTVGPNLAQILASHTNDRDWLDRIHTLLEDIISQNRDLIAQGAHKGDPEENGALERLRARINELKQDLAAHLGRFSVDVPELNDVLCRELEHVFEHAKTNGQWSDSNDDGTPGITWVYRQYIYSTRQLRENDVPMAPPTRHEIEGDCEEIMGLFADHIDSRIGELEFFAKQMGPLLYKFNGEYTVDHYLGTINALQANLQRVDGYYFVKGDHYEVDLLLYVLSGMKKDGGETSRQEEELLVPLKSALGLRANEPYALLMEAARIGGTYCRQLQKCGEEFFRDHRGNYMANINTLVSIAFPTGDDKDVWTQAHKYFGSKSSYSDKKEEAIAYVQLLHSCLHEIHNEINVLHTLKKLVPKDLDNLSEGQRVFCVTVCTIWANLEKLGEPKDVTLQLYFDRENMDALLTQIHGDENREELYRKAHLTHRQQKFMDEVIKHDLVEKVQKFDTVLSNESMLIYKSGTVIKDLIDDLRDLYDKIEERDDGLYYPGDLPNDLKPRLETADYAKIGQELRTLKDLMGPAGRTLVRGQASRFSYYRRFMRNYKGLEKDWGDICTELDQLSSLHTGNYVKRFKALFEKMEQQYQHGMEEIEKMSAEEKYCNDKIVGVIKHLSHEPSR